MRYAIRFGAVLLLLAVVVLPGPSRRAEAATPSFTKTVVATRTNLDGGADHEVDSRTVTVSVSETANLRGRQLVDVNWSGAHPTGGLVLDPNSNAGRLSEYPMVLLECRGVDSDQVSVDKRLDPSTCWTQTPSERFQATFGTAFPAWRLDRYAPPAERKASVGVPPNVCQLEAPAERMVPFVAADSTAYYAGDGCGTLAPEGSTVYDTAAPPSNETYGATAVDGTGHAKFEIWTAQQNASLGCSNSVPCALVAVPIMGVSCDATAAALPVEDRPTDDPQTTDVDEFAEAQSLCEKTGQYAQGTRQTTADPEKTDLAVAGALWWSTSNWRNRITVPLSFASFANVCDILDSRTPVDLYGSELLGQATDQWAPAFCQNPALFKFRHVQIGEPLAKTGLSAQEFPAALISRPPDTGYAEPTVNAPLAVSGFAISYSIDDGDGKEVTNLRLTPRLLAKLLSESYLTWPPLKDDLSRPDDKKHPKKNVPAAYKAIAGNPLTVTQDPEFIALNPRIGQNTGYPEGAASLLALSGQSDVMYALSQYINADPEARAFLDGKPDPWGMRVNPGYLHIALPVESWPLLDSYIPSPAFAGSPAYRACLLNAEQKVVPIPFLQMVSSPVSSLQTTAQKVQYGIVNSATKCVELLTPGGEVVSGSFKPEGRDAVGNRFVLALTALADGPRYGLRSAALQTDSVVPDLSARFTDDRGRDFAAPTTAALRAAIALTTPNDTTHTWPIPYETLRTKRGASAYPGTMVVYAAVPTSGLDHATARDLGELLEFAATDGQRAGLGQGQLPPGYLPMTGANGLGAMVLFTRRAADAVAAQLGSVPSIMETPGPPAPANASASPTPSAQTTPKAGAAPSAAASSDLSAYKPGVQLPVGYTAALGSRLAAWALPVVAAFGVLCALLAAVVRSRAGARAITRLQARLNRRISARETR